jgi:hypothetical protein
MSDGSSGKFNHRMINSDQLREPLPNANDIEALGTYYKKYYNTPLGRATVEEFMKNCERFV